MTAPPTIFITGSSSGFGRLIAETLIAQGHTVFATMRNSAERNLPAATALRTHADAHLGRVHILECDVTSDESVTRAVADTENEHVLLPGDFVHEVVFVSDGLLRLYYLSEDGFETNKAFVAENQCAKPLAASLMNLPVYYGTQALEPTQVLVADFVALYDEDPIFDRLGRRIAETILIGKEMRARTLLQQKARERYLTFVEQFPDLVDRVPQYHIASYLGITEVSLSRIKRGLRQTEPESVLSLAV